MAQIAAQSTNLFQRYRWKELRLLIIPCLILLLEMSQLTLIIKMDNNATVNLRNLPIAQSLIPIFGLIAVLFVVHIILTIFFPKSDQVLLPVVGMLGGLGVLMATRTGYGLEINTPNQGTSQLIWLILGMILLLGTLFILRSTNWLERYKYTWALVSILLILPSVIQGVRSFHTNTPARDLLKLGPINFQPSELLKITLVIFFAAYLNENRDIIARGYIRLGKLRIPPLRQLGPLILMLGIALIIFLIVRELGLALLIYGLFLCMTYLTSGKISYVIAYLVLFAVLAAIGYKLFGYVRDRFSVVGFDAVNWQNWSDKDNYFASNTGLQIIQGLISISSGGILGAGFGLGSAADYVPVINSDMVLTSFAEEMGLIGLFAIIGLYLLLVYRGYRIAIEARDTFSQLLAAGLTSIFAIQTLIICAGNLKLIPLTGIPLPFLSYGGSSLLANCIIIGILLRISHNTAMEREGLG